MFLPTAEDTDRLGAALACALDQNRSAIVRSGFNIRLEGNLGAGKTCACHNRSAERLGWANFTGQQGVGENCSRL